MQVIQMSCRKNFVSETELHDDLFCMIRWKENKGKLLNYDELIFNESFKNILIFIHGYKGIYENIEHRYTNITKTLKNPYDLIVEFYWPGSWSASIGYVAATNRVFRSSQMFNISIKRLLSSEGLKPENVRVMAHSLGCKLLLQYPIVYENRALSNLEYLLAAPAINIDEIKDTYISNSLKRADKVNIYYSRNDIVLKYFFRMVPSNWFSPAFIFKPELLSDYNNVKFVDMTDIIGKSHSKYYELDIL